MGIPTRHHAQPPLITINQKKYAKIMFFNSFTLKLIKDCSIFTSTYLFVVSPRGGWMFGMPSFFLPGSNRSMELVAHAQSGMWATEGVTVSVKDYIDTGNDFSILIPKNRDVLVSLGGLPNIHWFIDTGNGFVRGNVLLGPLGSNPTHPGITGELWDFRHSPCASVPPGTAADAGEPQCHVVSSRSVELARWLWVKTQRTPWFPLSFTSLFSL